MRTEVIYEDHDLLVCRKPAGLAVESAEIGQMDMVSELKNYLKASYLGVVHRVDQPVEGLLVFAKNKRTAADLTKQLQDNTLKKQYLAMVSGKPGLDKARLVNYLKKDQKRARIVAEKEPGAKEAVLHYQVLKTMEVSGCPISLVRVELDTGRFHQIRAQLSYAGCPLLGDRKYGDQASQEASEAVGAVWTALCAYGIALKHPVTGKPLEFTIRPEPGAFNLFANDF